MARTDTTLDYYLPLALKSMRDPHAEAPPRRAVRVLRRAGWVFASATVAAAFAYLRHL